MVRRGDDAKKPEVHGKIGAIIKKAKTSDDPYTPYNPGGYMQKVFASVKNTYFKIRRADEISLYDEGVEKRVEREAQRATSHEKLFLDRLSLAEEVFDLLPSQQQRILQPWIEGKTYEQMAAAEKKPIGTIRSSLHRAKGQAQRVAEEIHRQGRDHLSRPDKHVLRGVKDRSR